MALLSTEPGHSLQIRLNTGLLSASTNWYEWQMSWELSASYALHHAGNIHNTLPICSS